MTADEIREQIAHDVGAAEAYLVAAQQHARKGRMQDAFLAMRKAQLCLRMSLRLIDAEGEK